MTTSDLIRQLRREDPEGTMEVRAAVQPSYPMGAEIAGAIANDRTVWIAVEHQSDYDAPDGIHGHARRAANF